MAIKYSIQDIQTISNNRRAVQGLKYPCVDGFDYYSDKNGRLVKNSLSSSINLATTNLINSAIALIPKPILGLTKNYIPIAISSTTLGNSYLYQFNNNITLNPGKFLTSNEIGGVQIDLNPSTHAMYVTTDSGVFGESWLLLGPNTLQYGFNENYISINNTQIDFNAPTNQINIQASEVNIDGNLKLETGGSIFKYAPGSEGANKVLISDASGNTSWYAGASGTFTTADAKTVTVVKGLITSIV